MLTKDLDIPNNTQEPTQGWSVKRLLSGGGSIGKIVSTFNPFEFMFFVMILVTGLAEILNKNLSIMWYILVFILLFLGFIQRNSINIKHEETHDKPTV